MEEAVHKRPPIRPGFEVSLKVCVGVDVASKTIEQSEAMRVEQLQVRLRSKVKSIGLLFDLSPTTVRTVSRNDC